ncbi:MAG: T9SS type A sorting domain-containing protein [Saprospiraceae bacterium]
MNTYTLIGTNHNEIFTKNKNYGLVQPLSRSKLVFNHSVFARVKNCFQWQKVFLTILSFFFLIQLTLSDTGGCGVYTVTYTINPPNNCSSSNGSVTVNSTSGGTGPYSYVWNTVSGQSSIVNQSGNSITTIKAGIYNLQVTGTTGGTCSFNIVVGPFPSISGLPQLIQSVAGSSVTVSGVNPSNANSIIWVIDSGAAAGTLMNATTLTPTYNSDPTLDKGKVTRLKLTASSGGCGSDINYFRINFPTKLPLELKAFTGLSSDCTNKLSWQVGNAKNFKQFEIKASKNGKDFSTVSIIPSVPSNGFTNNNYLNREYSFNDSKNSFGNYYYKLKMVDLDDNYEDSKIIFIKNSCFGSSASLYPNPVSKSNNIQIQVADFGDHINGLIIDLTGKIIYSNLLINGTNTFELNSIQSGVYWLKIQDENKKEEILKLAVTN